MWCILNPILIKRKTNTYILCHCKCGKENAVEINKKNRTLNSGSCTKCAYKATKYAPGMQASKSYRVWRGMLGRCTNPDHKSYKNYGGRGITICDRWLTSFENFYADMGDAPLTLDLDRIDNEKGYYKENCRWVTRSHNTRNKRGSRMVMFGGVSMHVMDACKIVGLNHRSVYRRIDNFKNSSDEAFIYCIEKGWATNATLNV